MLKKSENFYFSKKDFSSIKKIKKKIQVIQERVRTVEDISFKKSLEILMGGKLFNLGLVNDPVDFKNKDIQTKNFLARTLICIIQRKKPRISFREGVNLIKSGKISIRSKIVYNPITMIGKEQEKYIKFRKN